VENNVVLAEDVTVYSLPGLDLAQTYYNSTAARQFGDPFEVPVGYTNIIVDNSFTLSGFASSSAGTSTNAGTILLDATRVTGEGLAGEVVDTTQSYDVTVQTIRDADFISSDTAVTYSDGQTLSFENNDGGDSTTPQAEMRLSGHSGLHGSFAPYRTDFGGNTTYVSGESDTVSIELEAPTAHASDTLGRVYYDEITFTFSTGYSEPGVNNAGLNGARSEVLTYTLEDTITNASSGTVGGTATIAVGEDLGGANIFYTFNDGTEGTTFSVIDSETLTAGGQVSISVSEISGLDAELQNATNNELISGQVFNLQGLDGNLHVIEMSYDENALGYSEGGARIGWFDADESGWRHAIMGNSDVGLQSYGEYTDGRSFTGGYQAYLDYIGGGSPVLGAYGVDKDQNVAWAVVDHNSSFAVIPEPGTLFMMFISCGAMGLYLMARKSFSR
jgi:hypothetical protein